MNGEAGKLSTPLRVDPWTDSYANIVDANDRPVCLDVKTDRAAAIVTAINAHSALTARVAELEAGLRKVVDASEALVFDCSSFAGVSDEAVSGAREANEAGLALLSRTSTGAETGARQELHVVFTDFPGPASECVFVEVEDAAGKSINAGQWRKRADGYAEFVIPGSPASPPSAAVVKALRDALKPFANHMAGGMDCDDTGAPLPDGQGVGWVYLTMLDFRRARAALSAFPEQTEQED